MSRLGTQLRKAKAGGAIAGFTITALVAALVPAVSLTNASWNDTEFDHAALGTENCATATNFTTRGGGKLVGGTLLGTNLDAVASLDGVTVTNGAGGAHVTPVGAQSLGSDAYANPLDVSALSAINVSLGSLLQLPLNTPVGVVNQYGQAHQNGSSAGASGVVNNSGGIALASTPPSSSVPTFATLDLGSLLGTLGLGSVANLANLHLSLGAVASSAQLNGCNALWTKTLAGNLQRDYEIAGLTTAFDSPLVKNLVTGVNTTTTNLTGVVNGVSGQTGLVNSLLSNLTGALGGPVVAPVLASVGVGTPTASISATVDFSGLTTLLNTPIADSQGIVKIDLANGTVAINTAALFDNANGLNNQAPNTQLLLNAGVINTLKTAVASALTNYVTAVTGLIDSALQAIKVKVDITVPLSAFGTGGGLAISTDATLATLTAGTAPLTATVNCTTNAIACAAAHVILDPVLSGLVSTLQGALEAPLGTGISGLVNPPVTALVSTLNGTSSGLVSLLGTVLAQLFGPASVLSLVVNDQNDPTPALANHPLPTWAASLPGPTTVPYSTGRYDVSALELTVAGASVTLDLARSSVGTNTLVP